MKRRTLIAAICLCIVGCELPLARPPMPEDEVPWMNLPRTMREWNWGGGSCVHASTVHNFRWQGRPDLAAKWRKTYAGGESSYGLRSKLDHAGVDYACTESGDIQFLEWCSRTRRGAVIFYFPNHSINFCGYNRDSSGREVAMLLDNNRIDSYIGVPKDQFLRAWRGYGGFALAPLPAPMPRLPYSIDKEP